LAHARDDRGRRGPPRRAQRRDRAGLRLEQSAGAITGGARPRPGGRPRGGASPPPAELQQEATFELSGFTLDSLLQAALSGATDGPFATQTAIESEGEIFGVPVLFSLAVTKPPLFAADQLQFCGSRFDQQGE